MAVKEEDKIEVQGGDALVNQVNNKKDGGDEKEGGFKQFISSVGDALSGFTEGIDKKMESVYDDREKRTRFLQGLNTIIEASSYKPIGQATSEVGMIAKGQKKGFLESEAIGQKRSKAETEKLKAQAALTKAMFELSQQPLDQDTLLSYIDFSEIISHGTASGIDARAAISKQSFIYEKPMIKPFPFQIDAYVVVIYSNIIGHTKKAVSKVKYQVDHTDQGLLLINILAEYTQEAILAIKQKDIIKLGSYRIFEVPYTDFIINMNAFKETNRKYAFNFPNYEVNGLYKESIEINLPEGRSFKELPGNQKFAFNGTEYTAVFKLISPVKVSIVRTYKPNREVIELKDYEAFKSFAEKVTEAENLQLLFQ